MHCQHRDVALNVGNKSSKEARLRTALLADRTESGRSCSELGGFRTALFSEHTTYHDEGIFIMQQAHQHLKRSSTRGAASRKFAHRLTMSLLTVSDGDDSDVFHEEASEDHQSSTIKNQMMRLREAAVVAAVDAFIQTRAEEAMCNIVSQHHPQFVSDVDGCPVSGINDSLCLVDTDQEVGFFHV